MLARLRVAASGATNIVSDALYGVTFSTDGSTAFVGNVGVSSIGVIDPSANSGSMLG